MVNRKRKGSISFYLKTIITPLKSTTIVPYSATYKLEDAYQAWTDKDVRGRGTEIDDAKKDELSFWHIAA